MMLTKATDYAGDDSGADDDLDAGDDDDDDGNDDDDGAAADADADFMHAHRRATVLRFDNMGIHILFM